MEKFLGLNGKPVVTGGRFLKWSPSVTVIPEFIILVDTTLTGSENDTMQLPIRGVDMTIDWGDGTIETGVNQTATPSSGNWRTHVYDTPGIKQIKITGLNWISFANTGDRLKLLEIQNWGTGQWASMHRAFMGCSNMTGTFTDVPQLGGFTDMVSMFNSATAFNSDISGWDVSNVTDMRFMFAGATDFSGDISQWDVSSVTSMISMFINATAFNSDISQWDVSSVTSMNQMFRNATNFNSDISQWDVAGVTNMDSMFWGATTFNRDLSGWCVSQIGGRPWSFDLGANSWVYNTNGDTGNTQGADPATIINRPIWGTCP